MNRFSIALACAGLSISAGAGAQDTAQTRTIQLSKVVLNPQIQPFNQHVKVGTICLFSGPPLDFGAGERTVDYERFERLFSTMIKTRGFNAVAKSSNLFDGETGGPGPDFLIGATFRPETVDICDSVNGTKGSISISVEWQLFDRGSRQVVETVTTRGTGQLLKFKPSGLTAMIDQAFSASLDALIEQGVFQKHLGNPAKASTAPTGN